MKLTLDSDPDGEPFPIVYKNVKGFIFMALTKEAGKYILNTYHGYGDLTSEEHENAKLEALVNQFGLYWQDARMWMRDLK